MFTSATAPAQKPLAEAEATEPLSQFKAIGYLQPRSSLCNGSGCIQKCKAIVTVIVASININHHLLDFLIN